MHAEIQPSRAIYVRLRQRAQLLRGLAICFVALIALTLAFGAIPYFLAGERAVSETRAGLEMRRLEAEHSRNGAGKRDRIAGEPASVGDAGPAGPQAAAQASPFPPAERAATAGPRSMLAVGDEAFSAAVIRITAVCLLIALIAIFASLYRYSMRLAAYYDEKADAIRLLESGDRRLESLLARTTLPLGLADGTPSRRAGDPRFSGSA